MKINDKKKSLLRNSIQLLILLIIIYASIYEGRYRIDPHHWGIMLSSAKDFVEGKLPYKDIYNIYGILTTVIHAIGYKYLGGNMISIIAITAIFYVLGLWMLYKITYKITEDIKIAWFVLIVCILMHPVAIYPWSNYIAFPFLMGGIYYLILNENTKQLIFAGFLFALGILSREGVAIPLSLIIIAFLATDFVIKNINIRDIFKQIIFIVGGSLIPLTIFVLYLVKNDITKYWVLLSVSLPKIYAQGQFPHMSSIKFLSPFFGELKKGVVNFDVHWIVIILMLGTVIWGGIYSIFNLQKCDEQRTRIIKLSFASLILLITTLHIPEIFRISTGSIVGFVVLFYWLKFLGKENVGFIVIFGVLLMNLFKVSSGNPFYPEEHLRSKAIYVSSPKLLTGQLWPIEKQEFYTNFKNSMSEIKKLNCDIKYHYNETMDTMLYALSPFERYQLTPYLHSLFDFLRPDLDYKRKITEAKEIIIFKITSSADLNNLQVPEGFMLYENLKTSPTQWVYKKGDALLILIPDNCIKK